MFALGIHLEGDNLECALLSRKGKRIRIECLQGFGKNLFRPHFLEKEVYKRREGYNSKKDIHIVSALSSDELLMRSVEFPLSSEADILKALPYQVEELIPFDPELSLVVPLIERKGKNCTRVDLFALRNVTMERHIDQLQALGIDPSWVISTPVALQNFANHFVPSEPTLIVFHFGWNTTELVLLIERDMVSTTHIDIGLKHFYRAMNRDSPNVDGFDVEKLKEEMRIIGAKNPQKSSLYQLVESFHKKTSRSIEFFKEKLAEERVGILYTGFLDAIEYLEGFMGGFKMETVRVPPYFDNDSATLSTHAIELGNALHILLKKKKRLQLRTGRWLGEAVLKRAKSRICRVLTVMGIFCALAGAVSQMILTKKAHELKHRFVEVGNSSYLREFFTSKRGSDFKRSEFLKEIDKELMEVKEKVPPLSYFSPPPCVSHLLNYLQTVLFSGRGELYVDSIDYRLEKMPTLKSPKEVYRAKVTLCFTCKDRKLVDWAYQSLCEGSFVEEISQIRSGHGADEYEVSFVYREI